MNNRVAWSLVNSIMKFHIDTLYCAPTLFPECSWISIVQWLWWGSNTRWNGKWYTMLSMYIEHCRAVSKVVGESDMELHVQAITCMCNGWLALSRVSIFTEKCQMVTWPPREHHSKKPWKAITNYIPINYFIII